MFNFSKLWKNKYNEKDYTSLSFNKLFFLNLKTIYSTNTTRIVVIFSPILVSLALSILLPITYSIGAGQIFVTTLSSGTIWGMTYFSIRKSTFFNNLSITKIKKWEIYLSILFTMLLVTFLSQISYLVSTIIFNKFLPPSLMEIIFNKISSIKINWLKVDWLTIYYSWFLSILLTFFCSLTIRNIFNTEKNYFIVLFIYVLILIPFGGLIRPFISNSSGVVVFNEITPIFYVSILFPQFSLNSFNYAAISSGANFIGWNFDFASSFNWSTDIKWNIVILYPPIILLLLIFTSYITTI